MAYTTIDDPSAYFQTKIYTGNGGALAVTNDGNSDLQPDWVWFKKRGANENHALVDTNRGIDRFLATNSTAVEQHQPTTGNTDADDIASFDTDGFTFSGGGGAYNQSSNTYVAWQWKANGGTTTTNDASATSVGDTDSVYQVNSTAKFSIVSWTGSGSGSINIAHGLGSTPKFIIIKQRNGDNSWLVYHHKNTVVDEAHDTFLKLHLTNGSSADANNYFMADTAPTSTVATFGSGTEANASGTYIGYFFDEVQGYSKFGSYTGNGNSDGTFIYTGFKPKYFLLKNITASSGSGGQHWQISDTERHPDNPLDLTLFAEVNAVEGGSWSIKDFLSNGVKIRGSNYAMNFSGDKYIYMAFAEHPFVSSEGVPVTAR